VFTIPNEDDATYEAQARVSSVDLQALATGFSRTGVVSGMAVSVSTGRDFDISSGAYEINGSPISSVAKTGTIGAGDATHPRIDIVSVDGDGSVRIAAGTPAADPVAPNVALDRVVLASIYVPAGMATLLSDMISDRRVFLVNAEVIGEHESRLDTAEADIAAVDATLSGLVADAINDGTTTVAPSQNAVFDALALKVPSSRTIAGLDLSADRTAAALKTALSLVKADVGLGSVDNTADSAKTLAATQITTGTIDTDRLPDVPYTVKLAPAAAFGALGATVGESVHGTIWSGTNFAINGSQYVLARSKVRGIAERFGFWFISATAAPGDTFYVVCYAPNANGMPGALLWSASGLVSSMSPGAWILNGLANPIPAGSYVGVKNGSTTGAVTLRAAGFTATHSPLADITGSYNAITANGTGAPAATAPSGFGLAQNLPSMIVRGV